MAGIGTQKPLPSNLSVSVTTSSSKVLPGNGARSVVTFINYGSYDIYLSKGATAVVGQGIYLVAGGGSSSFSANKDGIIFRGDIYAIASGGTSDLTICEEYN